MQHQPTSTSLIRQWRTFLLGLCCLLLMFEVVARFLFGDVLSEQQAVQDWDVARLEAASGTQLAVFGDSRTREGLNLDYFSRPTLNFSNNSQDLYYDWQLWQRYTTHLPKLRYCIVSLNHYTLGYELAMKDRNRVHAYQGVGIPPRALDLTWVNAVLARSYVYTYRTILVRSAMLKLERMLQGSRQVTADVGRFGRMRLVSEEDARSAARTHMSQRYDQSLVPVMSGYLHQLIQSALDRDVKVLLMTPPVTRAYRGAMHPSFLRQFDQQRRAVMDRYHGHTNLHYTDFSVDERFGPEDFKDIDHLSAAGRIKFTRVLDATLNEAWGADATEGSHD